MFLEIISGSSRSCYRLSVGPAEIRFHILGRAVFRPLLAVDGDCQVETGIPVVIRLRRIVTASLLEYPLAVRHVICINQILRGTVTTFPAVDTDRIIVTLRLAGIAIDATGEDYFLRNRSVAEIIILPEILVITGQTHPCGFADIDQFLVILRRIGPAGRIVAWIEKRARPVERGLCLQREDRGLAGPSGLRHRQRIRAEFAVVLDNQVLDGIAFIDYEFENLVGRRARKRIDLAG